MSDSTIIERPIPDKPWVRLSVVSLVLLVLAVVAWEVLARSMHHEPGSYDGGFNAMWAEERRELDGPAHDVRLVLTFGRGAMEWYENPSPAK